MIKGLKICGISEPKTLNYILNHRYPPKFIGFITNYKKSKRFVEYNKLKDLINVDKKQIKFTSVLVNPTDEILEKIQDLNFDYYQLYDVGPERTKEIKIKYGIKIITALTVSGEDDVIKYKNYLEICEWLKIKPNLSKIQFTLMNKIERFKNIKIRKKNINLLKKFKSKTEKQFYPENFNKK